MVKQMSKKNTIQERLVEWSSEYATKVASLPKDNWKFHRAAVWVARDISKTKRFGFNVDTWAELERVEKIFGRRLRKRVTHNLFHT